MTYLGVVIHSRVLLVDDVAGVSVAWDVGVMEKEERGVVWLVVGFQVWIGWEGWNWRRVIRE